jgi:hypothetical protein
MTPTKSEKERTEENTIADGTAVRVLQNYQDTEVGRKLPSIK